jgi:hypothetical protein
VPRVVHRKEYHQGHGRRHASGEPFPDRCSHTSDSIACPSHWQRARR